MRYILRTSALIILILILLSFSSSLQAMDLDVEEGLQEFIAGYRLPDLVVQDLRDPFLDFRPPEVEVAEREDPPAPPADPEVPEEPEEEEITEPDFTVTGLVSRGEDMAAIIQDGDRIEILRPGQSYDDYVFSHRINSRLVFTREGEQFELFAREGETR